MSKEATSWQLWKKNQRKKCPSCCPRFRWPQVSVTFSFLTWSHLEFLSPLHRLFKACWFFIKESGSNLLLNSFHLHHPPLEPHYNITDIIEAPNILALSIGKHFFCAINCAKNPQRGALQAACKSRPKNQLVKKCSPDVPYPFTLPSCLTACSP